MAMPDFIGIGAQKAGTTWLYDMLAQNPSIWLPPLKELHYFDRQNSTAKQRARRSEHVEGLIERFERGKPQKGSPGADKIAFLRTLVGDHMFSDAWYTSIFDHPDARERVTGEITPSYLELSPEEMEKVVNVLPTTKFIAIIREPYARSMSQFKMLVSRSKTVPRKEAEWQKFIDSITRQLRGAYSSSIPIWQSRFSADRLLFLPFGMLKTDPVGLLHQIEDFVGAKRFNDYQAVTEQVHKTREVEVPDWVADAIRDMTKPQADYLIEAFGEEFYNKTR